MEEGANLAKAETTKDNPMSTTSTTGKTSQTHEECLAEGEATMPDQADKTTPPSADTVASLATMRQSVTKRRASRPPQVDNSPTMPQTPTMTIMTECL